MTIPKIFLIYGGLLTWAIGRTAFLIQDSQGYYNKTVVGDFVTFAGFLVFAIGIFSKKSPREVEFKKLVDNKFGGKAWYRFLKAIILVAYVAAAILIFTLMGELNTDAIWFAFGVTLLPIELVRRVFYYTILGRVW